MSRKERISEKKGKGKKKMWVGRMRGRNERMRERK